MNLKGKINLKNGIELFKDKNFSEEKNEFKKIYTQKINKILIKLLKNKFFLYFLKYKKIENKDINTTIKSGIKGPETRLNGKKKITTYKKISLLLFLWQMSSLNILIYKFL